MKVYKRNLYLDRDDSKFNFGVTGELYVIEHNDKVYKVGYLYAGRFATEEDFNKVKTKNYTLWRTIPFAGITTICQERLVVMMGKDFPFEASFWKTKEAWDEWCEPKTTLGKVSKSSRDSEFFKTWYQSDEWSNVRQIRFSLQRKHYIKNLCYVDGMGWFLEEINWNDEFKVTKIRLSRVKDKDAKTILKNAESK